MSKSTRLKNGLTPKQNNFTNEVLKQIKETGQPNLTQAALKTYDTTDYKTAQNISSENLSNPIINEVIHQAIDGQGLTLNENLKEVIGLAKAEVVKVSAETKLKANLELLRLRGADPGKKSYQFNMSVKGKIKDLTYTEAQTELSELDTKIDELESDAGNQV